MILLESAHELASAIREDIIGEFQAINQYDAQCNSTSNTAVRAVWASIRDDEKVHVGQLLTLLCYVEPSFSSFLNAGEKAAKEMIGHFMKS